MKRREALQAIGAVSLSSFVTKTNSAQAANSDHAKHGMHSKGSSHQFAGVSLSDPHFLSKTNPLATVDQRDLEALALRIFQMPIVLKAKSRAADHWKTIVGRNITTEALARFDELVEEWAFNYTLKAVNSDANYPKVLGHLYGPPHEWFGMKVPGSRASGGDGPDNHYRIIPIDANARYEIHGRRFDPAPADVPFSLTGNMSLTMTLGILEWQDVQVNPDGTFVITVDPKPANGRKNHIQTKPGALYIFIRDCRADWRQIPNAYRVKRLDPPTSLPLTIDQMAERAALTMVDDVPALYWFMSVMAGVETNTITPPFNIGAIGGLVSQKISFARLNLSDDEAFVATIGSGDAPFHDFVLQDFWFRTFNYWNHTSTMNNSQGVTNADGSTTYVVCARDPGVHNWIDTLGFHELLIVNRWQGFPRNADPDRLPWAKGKLVKFTDIDQVLPGDMKRVTPTERDKQLAERLAQFQLRYVDR